MRIIITGGPKCGKSTMATTLGCPHVWRSDFMLETYFERYAPGALHGLADELLTWINRPGPWIIEGVPLILTLRAWRDQYGCSRKPCDRLIWRDRPYVDLTPPQRGLMNICAATLDDIKDWLNDVGVRVVRNPTNMVNLPGSPSPYYCYCAICTQPIGAAL